MSRDTINVTGDLIAYIRSVGVHEDADLAALREETAHHPYATMQIGPEQGAFMGLLVRCSARARHWKSVFSPAIAPWWLPKRWAREARCWRSM